MKTILIWIVVIALVIFGGYVYMNQEKAPESEADYLIEEAENRLRMNPELNTGAERPVVMYESDTGFQPKEMSIIAGQRVEFVNQSGGVELLVSFGDHLDHSAYPDSKTHPSLKPGETDAITFSATGTYEYHNHHDDEAHLGKVIVQ